MHGDYRPVVVPETGDTADELVRLIVAGFGQPMPSMTEYTGHSQGLQDFQANDSRLNLIHQAQPNHQASIPCRAVTEARRTSGQPP